MSVSFFKRAVRLALCKSDEEYFFLCPASGFLMLASDWAVSFVDRNPFMKALEGVQVPPFWVPFVQTGFSALKIILIFWVTWLVIKQAQEFFNFEDEKLASLKAKIAALIVLIPMPVLGSVIGTTIMLFALKGALDDPEEPPVPIDELPYKNLCYDVIEERYPYAQ